MCLKICHWLFLCLAGEELIEEFKGHEGWTSPPAHVKMEEMPVFAMLRNNSVSLSASANIRKMSAPWASSQSCGYQTRRTGESRLMYQYNSNIGVDVREQRARKYSVKVSSVLYCSKPTAIDKCLYEGSATFNTLDPFATAKKKKKNLKWR